MPSEAEEPLTLAALAAATGFYKSTILRLAGSLERFGYLVREESGAFRLGPSLWRLGSLYRGGFDLGEHSGRSCAGWSKQRLRPRHSMCARATCGCASTA